MEIFGFAAEIQKKTWKFLDFQQKSKKTHGKFLDFQQRSKKTHGKFWIFSRNPKKHMENFGFSAEIPKNTWKIFGFSAEIQKKHMENFGFSAEIQKKTWKIFGFSAEIQKNMEIQNFQKFLVRPIVLEILDFLKFWYLVTTESSLFNTLLTKGLHKIISGHVFRIRDLIDFYVLSILQSFFNKEFIQEIQRNLWRIRGLLDVQ